MAEDLAETVVEVPSDVLVQRLSDDESVFLNLATEQYFGLDSSGTAMWDALTTTGSVDKALAHLLAVFDVDEEVLRSDFDALISQLTRRGLLRIGPQS